MSLIELTAADGHTLQAWKAEPSGPPRGAIVLVQEIFGVNPHIRRVADGFAADGYLVIAPAFFDRVQRDFQTGYAQADIEAGRAIVGKLDWNDTMADLAAGIAAAAPAGKVAVIGYCWGGTVSWLAAGRAAGVTCTVPYYGGGIGGFLDAEPKVPVLLQIGENDTSPSPEVGRTAAERYPQRVQTHVYPGVGHGFNCDERGSFNAPAATLARQRTLAFLASHIG